jgi:Ion channel
MLTWISVPLGILFILVAVRDILLTLMTATGRGAISRWFMALAWRAMQPVIRRWHPYRELAGPVTFLGVIAIWTTMIVVGWALIYWPFLPNKFLVEFGLDLERDSPGNFLTALYFSMVVLATLGFGDIVPTGEWLRLLVPMEGLVGFGLITAGISWFLSIFPALSRRRRLAHQIALVREAEEDAVEHWKPDAAAALLDSFSTQLIEIRSDQIQFPVIYYFRDADPNAELVPNLRYLLDIASWAEDENREIGSPLYLHQHMLRRAVNDYIQIITSQFITLETDDPEELLEALAREHV